MYYPAIEWVSVDDHPGQTRVTVLRPGMSDLGKARYVAQSRSDVTDSMHEPRALVLTEVPDENTGGDENVDR